MHSGSDPVAEVCGIIMQKTESYAGIVVGVELAVVAGAILHAIGGANPVVFAAAVVGLEEEFVLLGSMNGFEVE